MHEYYAGICICLSFVYLHFVDIFNCFEDFVKKIKTKDFFNILTAYVGK